MTIRQCVMREIIIHEQLIFNLKLVNCKFDIIRYRYYIKLSNQIK